MFQKMITAIFLSYPDERLSAIIMLEKLNLFHLTVYFIDVKMAGSVLDEKSFSRSWVGLFLLKLDWSTGSAALLSWVVHPLF